MASKPSRAPRTYERGILCIVIGAAVLIAPSFMPATALRDTIGGASTVGWFAVVLGIALVVVDLVQRAKRKQR